MNRHGTRGPSWLEHFAIPGLIRYVALLNALVFLLHLAAPGYLSMLELDPALVLHGQVWRLVTWIFIPETLSPLWILFSLLFLLYLGDGLEAEMGAPRLTLFYLRGIALCTGVAFLMSLVFGNPPVGRANTFLNLSLLLAFATVYPDFKVLVFFILPVRISWLALFSVALMLIASIGQPLSVAATLGAALINYLIDFSGELRSKLGKQGSQVPPMKVTSPVEQSVMHRCASCGITEKSHPEAEFRVRSDGTEYCLDHLQGRSGL
jgi:membrane associated rhomboid family serine protease